MMAPDISDVRNIYFHQQMFRYEFLNRFLKVQNENHFLSIVQIAHCQEAGNSLFDI